MPQNGQDVEKVYYAYHAGGHADQIIRKAAGDATYYRTYFLYDKQGRTWMAVKDQWQLDGQTGEPVNAQRTWAREFRYAGSGRQRYLTQVRSLCNSEPRSVSKRNRQAKSASERFSPACAFRACRRDGRVMQDRSVHFKRNRPIPLADASRL